VSLAADRERRLEGRYRTVRPGRCGCRLARRVETAGVRGCLEEVPEGGGGVGVATGDRVGVVVEGGGDAAVVESSGDGDERDPGVEHLGSHEVAEIMEAEGSEPSGAAVAKERLGDPVRFPGSAAAVVAEREAVPGASGSLGVGREDGEGAGIEVDDVAASCLGAREHRTLGAFHPFVAERHTTPNEVDVVPAQSEELRPAGAGHRSEDQEGVELRIARSDVVEQRT
jgi:hypothetical protein